MASICKHKYFKWQNSKILGCFPVLIYTVLAKKKTNKKKSNQNQQRTKVHQHSTEFWFNEQSLMLTEASVRDYKK